MDWPHCASSACSSAGVSSRCLDAVQERLAAGDDPGIGAVLVDLDVQKGLSSELVLEILQDEGVRSAGETADDEGIEHCRGRQGTAQRAAFSVRFSSTCRAIPPRWRNPRAAACPWEWPGTPSVASFSGIRRFMPRSRALYDLPTITMAFLLRSASTSLPFACSAS